jgi:beta-glucosidase
VTLPGDRLARELTLASTVEEWSTHPRVGPVFLAGLADLAAGAPADRGIPALTPELLRMIGSMPMQKVADMLGDAVPASLFEQLMAHSRPTVDAAVAPEDGA